MKIINNNDQLRETVRVNADSPFNNWLIYLDDARDHFLINYLGLTLIENLEKDEPEEKYLKLLPLVRRTLGPYAMMLSSAEVSINFGDNGHTVSKSTNTAPASDAKIEKATTSLLERSWNNLEYLLDFLDNNIDDYPEWKTSKYYKNKQTKYFPSAEIFQDSGLIDINYSRLTFEKLRQLIIRVEKSDLAEFLPETVETFIFSSEATDADKAKAEKLKEKVRAFIGAKVGELHTSQTTRIQRSRHSDLEYKAMIRPLYSDDSNNNLNYYSTQVNFWKEQILSMLPDMGFDLSTNKIDWSNEGKKIFSAIT